MRYWHPLTEEAVDAVRDWGPDRILLLPLYPQYSTTTTASSRPPVASGSGPQGPSGTDHDPVLLSGARRVRGGGSGPDPGGAAGDRRERTPRILFSAHGLPEKIVARGDPYKFQVEQTAAAVVVCPAGESFDWVVCYQSRVGPLEWIRPYTEDEIRRAGAEGVPLIVAPIAFVSEHSETLVELDIEYRKLAEASGVPGYHRVATVNSDGGFVASLERAGG